MFLISKNRFIDDVYNNNVFPYNSAYYYYQVKHEEIKKKKPLLSFNEFKEYLMNAFYSGIHPISLQPILPIMDYEAIVNSLKAFYSINTVISPEGKDLYVF